MHYTRKTNKNAKGRLSLKNLFNLAVKSFCVFIKLFVINYVAKI